MQLVSCTLLRECQSFDRHVGSSQMTSKNENAYRGHVFVTDAGRKMQLADFIAREEDSIRGFRYLCHVWDDEARTISWPSQVSVRAQDFDSVAWKQVQALYPSADVEQNRWEKRIAAEDAMDETESEWSAADSVRTSSRKGARKKPRKKVSATDQRARDRRRSQANQRSMQKNRKVKSLLRAAKFLFIDEISTLDQVCGDFFCALVSAL